VRLHEDNSGCENWVAVGDDDFVETYKLEDDELRDLADNIADNLQNGDFDEDGAEFDTMNL